MCKPDLVYTYTLLSVEYTVSLLRGKTPLDMTQNSLMVRFQ